LSLVAVRLPRIFLIYAIPFMLVLCVIMPPFQVADELAHIERADQIRRGVAMSGRYGGTIDRGWVVFGQLYQPMWFKPDVKQTVLRAQASRSIRWTGPEKDVNFQNTAQYGPALYLPQVTGLVLGRVLELPLAWTLIIARILNGLVACLIGYLALDVCRRGRYLMFATLLLPMTMSEIGSASPDASIISLSLLAVALASKIIFENRVATSVEFALFALIVTTTTMARPSQLALAVLTPAFAGSRDPAWKARAVIAGVALGAILIWLRVLIDLVPPTAPGHSPSGQLQLLVTHPLMLPTLIVNSFQYQGVWLLKTLFGGLGWLDTLLPDWYYWVATAVLVGACAAPASNGPLLFPLVLAVSTIASLFAATCVALYMTWTPLGQATINGLQGRYMLPVLPLLAWVIPRYRSRSIDISLEWILLVFPLVSFAVTVQALAERYYGSWTVMCQALQALLWV
jgi:uncharacterized membrane protein